MIIDTTLAGDEAHFSDCRRFRYLLRRNLTSDNGGPRVITFCMLNPSTADAFTNDPTISKCIRLARGWDADVLEVVNLFALRSSDPQDLRLVADRGDDAFNDSVIIAAAARSHLFVCAWGNHGGYLGRGTAVRELLRESTKLHHLGRTHDGYPLHPLARGALWIPYDRKPIAWCP